MHCTADTHANVNRNTIKLDCQLPVDVILGEMYDVSIGILMIALISGVDMSTSNKISAKAAEYTRLAESMTGRRFIDPQGCAYVMMPNAGKTGSMKDGSRVFYVTMIAVDGSRKTVTLHPNAALPVLQGRSGVEFAVEPVHMTRKGRRPDPSSSKQRLGRWLAEHISKHAGDWTAMRADARVFATQELGMSDSMFATYYQSFRSNAPGWSLPEMTEETVH